MERKIYYIDKNKIKQKSNKNNNDNQDSNNNNINEKDEEEIDGNNINNVLDKMKNNINNLKLYKPIKENPNFKNMKNINNININNNVINNKDNIIINSINIENNFINNNSNIVYLNNKDDIPHKDFAKLLLEQKAKNNLNQQKNIGVEKDKNILDKNIGIDIDENLDVNQNIKKKQEYNINNLVNKSENKNNNVYILQNLKGISTQNNGYGSTLMSNVSYSSFLSFKNKKVKFVNLNASINQSLMNNKSRQEEIRKQEEEDQEKINQKEQEKMMKNILERLGGTKDIIKENENEQEDNNIDSIDEKNKISNIKNKNINKIQEESDSLLFNLSKKNEISKEQKNFEQVNTNINQVSIEKEKKIKINKIKCTLSFLDKGKAVFVSENDDIFWLPSSTLNENIKVGNSYLFQIDKINILIYF